MWLRKDIRALLALSALISIDYPGLGHAGAMNSSQAPIRVGKNVNVSAAFPNLGHYELWAAADPDHLGRLLACSMVMHQKPLVQGSHCYVSFDQGATWSVAAELDSPRSFDPYVVYGNGDSAFASLMLTPFRDMGVIGGAIGFYRSSDGGKSWRETATLPFMDREYIAVDRTHGQYGGRVYVDGTRYIPGFGDGRVGSISVFHSNDEGTSFQGPAQRADFAGGVFLNVNPVILSDGTLMLPFEHLAAGKSINVLDEPRPAEDPNATLELMTSTDGGESLSPPIHIADMHLDRATSESVVVSMMAADPGSAFYKDRLYLVWSDTQRRGQTTIRFSYSADKGKTWSPPTIVSDGAVGGGSGQWTDMLPTVAVNHDGVVLVAWYDGRAARDGLGWELRAATSLDGGVTFSPSARVSTVPSVYTQQMSWPIAEPGFGFRGITPRRARGSPIGIDLGVYPFVTNAGHTSGLAADSAGVFHPVWVDLRTGVSQLFTAPVTVTGPVTLHGGRDLDDLEDVTADVDLVADAANYDRVKGTLTLDVKVKNTSTRTLRRPLRFRVVGLGSDPDGQVSTEEGEGGELAVSAPPGIPSIVDAMNRLKGVGAIWDLSDAIPEAGLPPQGTSKGFPIAIKLSPSPRLRASREPNGAQHFTPDGVLSVNVLVFSPGKQPGNQ